MKKYVLILVFITVLMPAQEKEKINLDGKFALLFQIDENFNFTNFEGATFSGKYHLKDKLSLRLGLMFNSSNFSAESNIYEETPNQQKDDETRLIINTHINLLNSFELLDRVLFYWGGGFHFTIDNRERISKRTNENIEVRRKSDEFTYGLQLISGVEWFVKNNISLIAEYGAAMYKANNNIKEYQIEAEQEILYREVDQSNFVISQFPVKLGVSVYF